MPSSCKDIRAALADCLQHSECVLVQRHTASDCLRHPLVETLPTRCQQLKKGYADCRRGLLDMRKRFRGNYPAAAGALPPELDGARLAAGESAGQLYAGRRRPLFADAQESPPAGPHADSQPESSSTTAD